MDAKELKSKLTLEHVVQILEDLGAEPRQGSNLNEIWCKTICHSGNSHKLYLFKDSLNFHCFTHCGSLDILQVVRNVLDYSLQQAIEYISTKFGFYNNTFKYGFDNTIHTNNLDIISSFMSKREVVKTEEWKPFKKIDEEVLKQFYDFYHSSFYKDGISPAVLQKFEVKYDILNFRVIIPHRYADGTLIAVRCRNLDDYLISKGMKYTPIVNDGKLLSAPTGQYFYGLYQNANNIMRAKKVVLVESEKAVMQYETMYPDANITLALSSSNLSNFQLNILKELGVEEVIVALDKEFESAGTEEERLYARKLEKSIINRINFCKVSVLWDVKGLLKKKDSPLDKGKKVFEDLFKNRKYKQS
ncbi:hypothetical protein [Romboutsia sp.]|uniref:hypothetical protein n=1 Tax=Romboutsia sp. TaxID=1965302 RepID=UPI002C1EF561|nr:hypothetical protein [Romboutsia sp.]HSQ88001.1 hypothetical protein [Romboutsia sp.]